MTDSDTKHDQPHFLSPPGVLLSAGNIKSLSKVCPLPVCFSRVIKSCYHVLIKHDSATCQQANSVFTAEVDRKCAVWTLLTVRVTERFNILTSRLKRQLLEFVDTHMHDWVLWDPGAIKLHRRIIQPENQRTKLRTLKRNIDPKSSHLSVRKKGREWVEPELNFTLVVKQQPSWDDVFFWFQQQNAPNWNVTGRSGCSYGDASVHLFMCTSIRSVGGRCVCVYGSS